MFLIWNTNIFYSISTIFTCIVFVEREIIDCIIPISIFTFWESIIPFQLFPLISCIYLVLNNNCFPLFVFYENVYTPFVGYVFCINRAWRCFNASLIINYRDEGFKIFILLPVIPFWVKETSNNSWMHDLIMVNSAYLEYIKAFTAMKALFFFYLLFL